MRQRASERGDVVGVELQRDEPVECGAAAAGDLEAHERDLPRGVRDEREGVRHDAKRIRHARSDRGRRDLAQQHLELVDGATETEHERFRTLATRTGARERALLLEPRELGGRASQTRERERRRKAPAQLCDTLLELLESAAQFVLELLSGEIVETLHFALQRRDVGLPELRGPLEAIPLRERLANAADLLHRIG